MPCHHYRHYGWSGIIIIIWLKIFIILHLTIKSYILRSNLTSYYQILHSPNKSVIGLIPLLSLATQGFSQDWSKCFLNIELSFSEFQFDDKCCWNTQMCQNRDFPFLTSSSYIWNVSKVERATFDKWIPTSRFDHRYTESLGWRHFVVVGLF